MRESRGRGMTVSGGTPPSGFRQSPGRGVAHDVTDLQKGRFSVLREGDAYGHESCAIESRYAPGRGGDKATTK